MRRTRRWRHARFPRSYRRLTFLRRLAGHFMALLHDRWLRSVIASLSCGRPRFTKTCFSRRRSRLFPRKIYVAPRLLEDLRNQGSALRTLIRPLLIRSMFSLIKLLFLTATSAAVPASAKEQKHYHHHQSSKLLSHFPSSSKPFPVNQLPIIQLFFQSQDLPGVLQTFTTRSVP